MYKCARWARASSRPRKHPTSWVFNCSGSRAYADKTGCGTLGGYVLVDGVKYGLTNHHVCFGFMRSEPYPNEAEIIPRYAIKQPAEDDLESTLASLRDQEMSMEDVQAPETVLNPLREKIRLFESWKSENRTIGYVYRSSGLRACDGEVGIRFRMDWALIRLEDLMTPSNGDPIFNKVSSSPRSNISNHRNLLIIDTFLFYSSAD